MKKEGGLSQRGREERMRGLRGGGGVRMDRYIKPYLARFPSPQWAHDGTERWETGLFAHMEIRDK